MANEEIIIFLADDDEDDCLLFGEALKEIALPTKLKTVHNGEQLLHLLGSMNDQLPHVLFLDLNMPRINGWQCLKEIKRNENLKLLRVVIFSTSFHQEMADELYKSGIMHYIRKPSDFDELKSAIHLVLQMVQHEGSTFVNK